MARVTHDGDLTAPPPPTSKGAPDAAGRVAKPWVDRLFVVPAIILAVASLATAWLRYEGVEGMLWSLHGPLETANVIVAPFPVAVRLYPALPVALALVAALAMATTLLRKASAWVLFAVGSAMVASALFPSVLVGIRAAAPVGTQALLRSCGPGALLFAASGIVVLAAASRRLDSTDYRSATSWRGFWAVLGCVAVVFLSFGALLAGFPAGGGARFSVTDSAEALMISCGNLERRSVSVGVPWPMVGFGTASDDVGEPQYGLALSVRAPGETTFEPLTDTGDALSTRGRPLQPYEVLPLDPGAEIEIRLDLAALQEAAGPLETLRVVCSDRRGRTLLEHETALSAPELPAGPLVQADEALNAGANATPEDSVFSEPDSPAPVELPVTSAPTQGPPQPAPEVERAPTGVEPGPQASPTIRIRAVVGTRLAFTLRQTPDARAERALAGVGDEVATDWVVRSIDAAGPSAELTHTPSGKTVVVDAGKDVALAP